MRQSIQTGQDLYTTIRELEKEVATIKEALFNVSAQMGKDNPAYTILEEKQKEVVSKLNNLLETKFSVVGR